MGRLAGSVIVGLLLVSVAGYGQTNSGGSTADCRYSESDPDAFHRCWDAATASAGDSTLSTENLTAEITRHVIDPCYKHIVEIAGINEFVSDGEALSLIKLIETENIKVMIDTVLPIVEGKGLSARMAIYKVSAQTCINGANQG